MQNLEEVKEQAGELSTFLIGKSNELAIFDHEDLERASAINIQAKTEIKIIEAAFKPHKDNAYKAHKDLCKAEAEQLAPFKQIGAILKPKILEYRIAEGKREAKEKEEREAKQRQAEAESKEQAEKEKARQVEGLMDAGDFDKAEMVMEAPTPEPVAAYVPEPEKVKVAGAGTRQVWKARVLDQFKVPEAFKVVDQKALDSYAKSTQGRQKMEGVEFYQETQLTGK